MNERVDKAMRLGVEYFSGQATELAPDLLGKLLCRKDSEGIGRYRITETECYYGESDTACHASKGRTNRTKVLYERGGVAYIYLCYGIHHLFNVVTGEPESPQAVLIRGVEGYNGPGRLTKALGIDRTLNEADLTVSDQVWIEDDGYRPRYECSRRIGIAYAEEVDRNRLWRFCALEESIK